MASDEKNPLLFHKLSSSKGDEKQENEKKSLWADSNMRQKFVLIHVITTNFFTLACTSVPSPFLARVVTCKRGTSLHSAIILQSIALSLAVSSIVFGKFQPAIGCKRLFVGGLALFSACQIAFGFIESISNTAAFVATATALRTLQGVGQGAFAVSSLTLVCQEYPRHVGSVFGLTEAAFGAGYLIGPAFGGALYGIGGMFLPMTASGALMFITVPLSLVLLGSYSFDDATKKKFSMSDVLWNPKALLLLFATGSVWGGYGLCDSILTDYAKSRNMSVASAGIVLLSMGVSYCLGSIASGHLINQKNWIKSFMAAIGYPGAALSGLIYTNHQTEAWIYVGSAIFGLFSSFCCVSSFDELIRVCGGGSNGEDSFALHSAISGAWYFVLGIATFVLCLVGSELQTELGNFSLALVMTICLGYSSAVLIAGTVYAIKMCGKTSSK